MALFPIERSVYIFDLLIRKVVVVIYDKLLRKYRKLVKTNMISLQVYRKEFDSLIDVYAGLLVQYHILNQRLIDSGVDVEVETQRGGTRKSATATALEKLRSDLIIYSDRLCLSPKALISAKLKVPEEGSQLGKLEKILVQMDQKD